VLKPARYRQFLRPAFRAAQQGRIAVLGIQPRWAETGYGYVEFTSGAPTGATITNVLSFREKPGESLAREYVASGRFFWNSGMFFWRAQTLLEELRKHLPKTASLLASLPAFRSSRFHACLREVFPLCESISIDFAVLEKADRVVGVRCDDIGWNDVGSWNAVYELSTRDTSGNVLPTGALALDSGGNYVDARGKTVALLGVKNLIVVDTPDALLVADRARAQDVGGIVKMLDDQKREDLL
jgi:mannose-1-phosphate guanylyltransferase